MRYWKNLNGSVEAYSHDLDITKSEGHENAIEITKENYDAVIASLTPTIIEPYEQFKAMLKRAKQEGLI